MTEEERRKGSIWVRKLEAALMTSNMLKKSTKEIDPCIVNEIIEMRKSNMSHSEIGKILNMSAKTVQKYLGQEKAPSTVGAAKGSDLKNHW